MAGPSLDVPRTKWCAAYLRCSMGSLLADQQNKCSDSYQQGTQQKRTPLCKAGFEVEGRGAHGDEVCPVRGYNYPTSPSQSVTHITSANQKRHLQSLTIRLRTEFS